MILASLFNVFKLLYIICFRHDVAACWKDQIPTCGAAIALAREADYAENERLVAVHPAMPALLGNDLHGIAHLTFSRRVVPRLLQVRTRHRADAWGPSVRLGVSPWGASQRWSFHSLPYGKDGGE